MDKIIELICEEARRRPEKDFIRAIYAVKLELDIKVGEVMAATWAADRVKEDNKHLKGPGENDP
jgi:hypothetical protein